MIATLIVAGLFVIVGIVGGWILYMLSGMDGDICDTCGRESTRSERAAWIEYRGEIFCSGDCFRGRDA